MIDPHSLPTVNAALNSLCFCLLLAGFVAVRTRWIKTHIALMTAALAVSAVFLASYLYFHFVVKGGEPTRFTAEGPIRMVYFAILLSHTLLAAIVAPLALGVAYLGFRNRLDRHRQLARWTLPIWLYVSVTGVAVYLLLYHLYPPQN